MNTILAATQFFGGDVIGLLERIAIVCVVVWAINALLEYAGYPPPPPVRIIAIALISILIIIWLFQIFAQLAAT